MLDLLFAKVERLSQDINNTCAQFLEEEKALTDRVPEIYRDSTLYCHSESSREDWVRIGTAYDACMHFRRTTDDDEEHDSEDRRRDVGVTEELYTLVIRSAAVDPAARSPTSTTTVKAKTSSSGMSIAAACFFSIVSYPSAH